MSSAKSQDTISITLNGKFNYISMYSCHIWSEFLNSPFNGSLLIYRNDRFLYINFVLCNFTELIDKF